MIVIGFVHSRQERRSSFRPYLIPKTRLRRGDFFADIVTDRREDPPFFHVVVQHSGSNEILGLCQLQSHQSALDYAETYLCQLAEEERTGLA